MEYNNYDIQKFKIYVKTVPSTATTEGYEFVMPNGTTSEQIPDDCINSINPRPLPGAFVTGTLLGNSHRGLMVSSPTTCGIGWLPVLLTRTYDHYEYVNTKRDDTIETIVRQKVNPYFIELDFFNNIDRIFPNNSYDLNQYMYDKIKEVQVKETYFLNKIAFEFPADQTSRFYQLVGLFLESPYPTDISSNYVRLVGTPYLENEYLIREKEFDIDGNLIAVYVSGWPQSIPFSNLILTGGYQTETPSGSGYSGARIEFLRFKSDTTSIDMWFDRVGRNMILPTKKESDINNIIDLTDIELTTFNWGSVVSKAARYPIEIWK